MPLVLVGVSAAIGGTIIGVIATKFSRWIRKIKRRVEAQLDATDALLADGRRLMADAEGRVNRLSSAVRAALSE